MSEKVKAQVAPEFARYGFSVANFFIQSINFPDEDFDKINQILANRAEFEIMGDGRYTTKRAFDVYEGAANNQSGVAGAFAAGGIGLGAAEIVICFSDVLPGNRLVLACAFALFVSFPFAVLNVLPGAMMADIIQYDTVTTGVNQEGIFGAARSFIVKMGNSLAIMIVPSLVVAGAAAGENVGVFGLKLTAVAGSVFCILAIFAFLRYNEREVLATIAAGSKEGE